MTTHPRVLIVDDEASLRRQVMVGLTQHGYEVDECEEGLPALTKIKIAKTIHHPFGCIILDVRLPDISGLKILSAIKSAYPELPVVVITGYGNEDTVNTVQSREGSAYLDKPFRMEELVSELDRIGIREESKPDLKAGKEAAVLTSAFVLVRAPREADLSGLYDRLNFAEGVCYCDPVLGDWDLLLLFQAPDHAGIESLVQKSIQSSSDIEAWEVHHCERPQISHEFEEFIQDYEKGRAMSQPGETEFDQRSIRMFTSYVLLDVDPYRLPNLYMKLYFTDHVVHCDVTDSGKQIVLLLQGVSMQMIQATIRNEIRLMPGILRIKQLDTLNFATK
jgi:two-component system, LuxR family, response regulator FixJ